MFNPPLTPQEEEDYFWLMLGLMVIACCVSFLFSTRLPIID